MTLVDPTVLKQSLAPLTIGGWRRLYDAIRDDYMRRACAIGKFLTPAAAATFAQEAARYAHKIGLGSPEGTAALYSPEGLLMWLHACAVKGNPQVTVEQLAEHYGPDDMPALSLVLNEVCYPDRPTVGPPATSDDGPTNR